MQLSVSQGGRTRTRHLAAGRAGEVTQWVSNYRLLWRLVEELTVVNLELLALGDEAADGSQEAAGDK